MNIVHSESPRCHFVYFYERTLQKCPETLGEATSKQAHIKNTSNGYTGMCYVTGGVYTGFSELSSDLKLRTPGARLYRWWAEAVYRDFRLHTPQWPHFSWYEKILYDLLNVTQCPLTTGSGTLSGKLSLKSKNLSIRKCDLFCEEIHLWRIRTNQICFLPVWIPDSCAAQNHGEFRSP